MAQLKAQTSVNATQYTYYCTSCPRIKKLTLTIGQTYPCAKAFHEILTDADFKYRNDLRDLKRYFKPLVFDENFKLRDCVINSDASVRYTNQEIAYGVSVRHSSLRFIEAKAFCYKDFTEYPIGSWRIVDAETFALHQAILMANSYAIPTLDDPEHKKVRTEFNWTRFRLFSECLPVVNAFNKGQMTFMDNGEQNHVNRQLINECRVLAGLAPWEEGQLEPENPIPADHYISVEWIYRQKNFFADLLAKVKTETSAHKSVELSEEEQKAIYEDQVLHITRIRDTTTDDNLKTLPEYERGKKGNTGGGNVRSISYDQFDGMTAVARKDTEETTTTRKEKKKKKEKDTSPSKLSAHPRAVFSMELWRRQR